MLCVLLSIKQTKGAKMKTWWQELTANGDIKIIECDWCYESNVLFDTGISMVCEECLRNEEFRDTTEALTNEERNS